MSVCHIDKLFWSPAEKTVRHISLNKSSEHFLKTLNDNSGRFMFLDQTDSLKQSNINLRDTKGEKDANWTFNIHFIYMTKQKRHCYANSNK